jgi:hypothetical protein
MTAMSKTLSIRRFGFPQFLDKSQFGLCRITETACPKQAIIDIQGIPVPKNFRPDHPSVEEAERHVRGLYVEGDNWRIDESP